MLLSDAPTVALTSALQYAKPNALHGMGGIGKSVIARALCGDPKMQAKFSDGILWITLGQIPELIPKMRDWVNALGGTVTENAPTVDSLKVALTKLLEDRACLLILDDDCRLRPVPTDTSSTRSPSFTSSSSRYSRRRVWTTFIPFQRE